MRVIALYNIKGGVGKTAAAVNLAWHSARDGRPTLLWDLDPQGAASWCLQVPPKVKGGRKALLRGKSPLARSVTPTAYDNLELLPADFSYRNMDLDLSEKKRPEKQLRKLLDAVQAAAASPKAGLRRYGRLDHAWILMRLHSGLRTGEVRRLRPG